MKKKKGFTLVELLVVIAILGVLATVTTTSYINFTKKAKASNDISFVSQLNLLLKTEEINKKVRTPEDALNVLKNNGYSLSDLITSNEDSQIAWNQKYNNFVLLENDEVVFGDTAPSNFYYWKFLDNIEDTDFSIYLKGANEYEEVNIKSGLDVGNNKIKQINYINNSQKEDVLILTSEEYITSLYIDGLYDTISHYGYLTDLNIHAISDHTYIEHGKVLSSIKLDQGHFIGEEGSEIPSSNLNGDVSKCIIWSEPIYTWDETYSTCVAIRKDLNKKVEDQIEEGKINILKYVEATCDESGEKIVEANFENIAFTRQQKELIIPIHEHIEKLLPRIEPTCLKTGLTEGKICAECGKVLVEQEVLPISDHHYNENGVCVDCQNELVNKDWKDFDNTPNKTIDSKEFESLLKDKEYVKLNDDIDFSESVNEIDINTNKVINLNGHTIEMYRSLAGKSFFNCSGENNTITFMNGSIVGVGNDKTNAVSTLIYCKKAKLVLDNVNVIHKEFTSTSIETEDGANVTIKKSNIVAHYAIKNTKSTINIEDSHIGSDDRIVCSKAIDLLSGTINVIKSNITGKNPIVNDNGSLTIKESTVSSKDLAVEVNKGETNLYNCVINGKNGIKNKNSKNVYIHDLNINVSDRAIYIDNDTKISGYSTYIKGNTAIEVNYKGKGYFNNCEVHEKRKIDEFKFIVHYKGELTLDNCSTFDN
ncbi:calcineurin-like phosphoesterase [Firmicutes bacterium CAG:449]|nr:calcineurin-like phosphoesterase [Firmicutes bacterium CAG:449]